MNGYDWVPNWLLEIIKAPTWQQKLFLIVGFIALLAWSASACRSRPSGSVSESWPSIPVRTSAPSVPAPSIGTNPLFGSSRTPFYSASNEPKLPTLGTDPARTSETLVVPRWPIGMTNMGALNQQLRQMNQRNMVQLTTFNQQLAAINRQHLANMKALNEQLEAMNQRNLARWPYRR
jgi:hypothetical protein